MKKLDQIQGCLVGGAIGDSIGFISEMKNRTDLMTFIRELKSNNLKTCTHRTYPRDYKFGQYSDDTQFTTLLIESILDNQKLVPDEYLKLLISKYQKNDLVGIGSGTKKVFDTAISNGDMSLVNKNSSNGSLMRTSPIGLIFTNKNFIAQNAIMQSKLTHDHEDSIKACVVYSLTVHAILNDSQITNEELKQLWSEYIDVSFLNLSLRDFLKYVKNTYPNPTWTYIPAGAMVTLIGVLYSFYHNRVNFTRALFTGLFLGGDTDSVASLVCSLIGLEIGLKAIPSNFRGIVHDEGQRGEDYLIELANKIYFID